MNSMSIEAGLMAEQIKTGLRRNARFGKIRPDGGCVKPQYGPPHVVVSGLDLIIARQPH
jgi:hypothetical protein